MTTEQAIENIETIKGMYLWSTGADEALDMAKKALERQIPKKTLEKGVRIICPNCLKWCYIINFCPWCGQAVYRGDEI